MRGRDFKENKLPLYQFRDMVDLCSDCEVGTLRRIRVSSLELYSICLYGHVSR